MRFPFQRPHLLSSQMQLWISQRGRERGSFSVKATGQWLVPPGSAHMKASEVTVTHRISGQGLILKKRTFPFPNGVPTYRPSQTHSAGSPQPPHTPGGLPFPNQFLLQGYNKVFLGLIDVRSALKKEGLEIAPNLRPGERRPRGPAGLARWCFLSHGMSAVSVQ